MKTRVSILLILMSSAGYAQETLPTAAQIIEQIKLNIGVPWHQPTVDVFKAGDSNVTVTGIAVTMMATLDVLQRAAAKGENLIITHEPIFYNHFDSIVRLKESHDPVFEAKQAFINAHHLVVWRFHDFWHARRPDGIRTGMVRALGWGKYQDAEAGDVFHIPPTTLDDLAKALKQKLDIHALRVVGDPHASVSTVGLSEGFPGFDANREIFQREGVDVLVIGEAHEWETIEYAADAVTMNNRKGLIVIGHIPSEQAGMQECARWLKTFLTGVPIEFVPAHEPFWVPE